jgi:hypothetical protein
LPQNRGGVKDRPLEQEYVAKYRTGMPLLKGALAEIFTSSITHCLIPHTLTSSPHLCRLMNSGEITNAHKTRWYENTN